jgi:hypothetical protein
VAALAARDQASSTAAVVMVRRVFISRASGCC